MPLLSRGTIAKASAARRPSCLRESTPIPSSHTEVCDPCKFLCVPGSWAGAHFLVLPMQRCFPNVTCRQPLAHTCGGWFQTLSCPHHLCLGAVPPCSAPCRSVASSEIRNVSPPTLFFFKALSAALPMTSQSLRFISVDTVSLPLCRTAPVSGDPLISACSRWWCPAPSCAYCL